MENTIKDLDNIYVSTSALAKILGITTRNIRYLAEEGICVRAKTGRYNLQESVKNYVTWLKVEHSTMQSETKNNEEFDIEKEKALHEHAKRTITELKLAKMKNEVHLASDVERVMTDMLGAMKSKLLSLPSKTAPTMAGNDFDKETYIKVMSSEIRECLEELSDYNPENFVGEEYMDVDEDG